MKALIYASEYITHKTEQVFRELDVQTVTFPGESSIGNHAYLKEYTKNIDLVIIDITIQNAEYWCRLFGRVYFVPLVILFNRYSVNWNIMDNFEAIGFIELESGEEEYRIRIKRMVDFVHNRLKYRESGLSPGIIVNAQNIVNS